MATVTASDLAEMLSSGEQDTETLEELIAVHKERNEFLAQSLDGLSEIDDRLAALQEKLGMGTTSSSKRTSAKSATGGSKRGHKTARSPSRNPYNLNWYIRQVMSKSTGVVTEDKIVEGVVEMGYTSNAADLSNSVYTTLYKMQKAEKVYAKKDGKEKKEVATVKKEGGRAWKLTAAGRAAVKIDTEIEAREQKLGSAA